MMYKRSEGSLVYRVTIVLLDYRFKSKRETERVEYSRNPIDEEQRLVSFCSVSRFERRPRT